jgi:hypothetical protein
MQTIDRQGLRDSWLSYFDHVDTPEHYRGGGAAFIPDPREILSRAAMVQWLKHAGFSDFFEQVLVEESISFALVQRLATNHGQERAKQILRRLLK